MSLESFLSRSNLLHNAGKGKGKGRGEERNSEILIYFDLFVVLIIGARENNNIMRND
jgi:hypothetical protein